jgi:uncharacterized protein (DUF2235 family)
MPGPADEDVVAQLHELQNQLKQTEAQVKSLNSEINEIKTRKPNRFVLCFDGTSNQYMGDESDTNIVKIYKMLDRNTDDQYHYYQREF